MQRELAKQLLSKIMEWDSEDVENNLRMLEGLADWKYDSYQQYQPGSRFLENLSIWLNSFEMLEERQLALRFLQEKLIYISPEEIIHIVSMVYPDYIVPLLKKQADNICMEQGISAELDKDKVLAILKKESLFLGLSDGARTDVFRRANPSLMHDQVCLSYELPETKIDDICQSIKKEIQKMKLPTNLRQLSESQIIKNIFLLDDFSASGISFIRKDTQSGEWGGKINKLLKYLNESNDLLHAKITIILYLATNKAVNYIKNMATNLFADQKVEVDVYAAQLVHPYELNPQEDALFRKYFDSSIIDSHYEKGKIDKPYLGFDECSLPLVLYHNTPNNSFPILWSTDRALFPRITRHKDV